MQHKVNWSDDASIDLDEIRAYLEGFSIQTANRILGTIIAQTNRLAVFPYRCPLITEDSPMRRLVVDDYSVFYVIFEVNETVQVLRVWHQSRDISQLM